jgi:cytochrome c553
MIFKMQMFATRILQSAVIFLFGALSATSVQAAGDPERGAVLAVACLGCHGIPGYRNAYPSYRVPKLGGQQEDYIVIGLQGYKSLGRAHPTMHAQSATLTEQDMRDLAAYFVAQGGLEQGTAPAGGQVARGGEKAAVCGACHGPTGVSPAPNWPSLAGQHKDYLVEVIAQYKNGQRNDPVMVGQVISLSDEDIEDIAAFYSVQPGLFTVD